MRRTTNDSPQVRRQRRAEAQLLQTERERSELSDFLLVFGEIVDQILPFGLGSRLARRMVRRRARRHHRRTVG